MPNSLWWTSMAPSLRSTTSALTGVASSARGRSTTTGVTGRSSVRCTAVCSTFARETCSKHLRRPLYARTRSKSKRARLGSRPSDAMTTTAERLTSIQEQIDAAAATVEADTGASPVLGAVVQELARKAQKAVDGLPGADDVTLRVSIVEVEQAADSAKAAAEVDLGVSDATRQAVLDAHLAICILKSKTA